MKAIILSGGRGNRLRPITDYAPKPLIPINNKPIIEWQIKYLKNFGINDIIISTGYKYDQIENFLKIKKNHGISIKYSIEKTPLGTGGAIKKAAKLIKEKSFFVMNGDVITNIDLKKLKSKMNSIAAIKLRTRFGVLDTKDDKILKFNEKKEIKNLWMNAGIYYLSKNIVKDLPIRGNIETTTFPKYAKNGKLNFVKFKNIKWHSIDSYKDIEICSKEVATIIK